MFVRELVLRNKDDSRLALNCKSCEFGKKTRENTPLLFLRNFIKFRKRRKKKIDDIKNIACALMTTTMATAKLRTKKLCNTFLIDNISILVVL